jgi:hypothetical protein
MTTIHPSNYSVAIRKDGKLFRVPRNAEYGDKYPVDEYALQHPNQPTTIKNHFFDENGNLCEEFWSLERLL